MDKELLELEKAIRRHHMDFVYMEDEQKVIDYFKDILVLDKKVALGGSVTLSQLGLIDLIRRSPVSFIDRYEEGISNEELDKRFREAFFADIFITSSNALTMDGCLYNVDGRGNRVAAMIYGPKDVYVVVGKNKLCKDEDEAIQRIRNIAAPLNAQRLSKKTPCASLNHCVDCYSQDRICCSYVKLGYQQVHNRIHIVFINKELGY